uniref:FHF complex subunit HOOK-interacting protein C-terminal domain-containing protein n=1 Tax=Oryzias latipes TaxID=8090 RepID=A0A3P9M7S3_ORYLA
MEAFGKLTSMLLNALETREPTADLLDSFVDNWKSVTNYYIKTTDDSRPVGQTDIPWRLRQMLDILVYEEKQQAVEDMGPCLEYLLQHKLLETLSTLAKAQYPPGMLQQVLIFFWKLLSQMQKPLLQLVNVYRPVQKLIRLCGLPGSLTQKEEAQFLFAVCSAVRKDLEVLGYVLEPPDQQLRTPASDQNPAPLLPQLAESNPVPAAACRSSPVFPENGLIWALMKLTSSQRASVRLKARQSLLLLSGLPGGPSAELLSADTQLAELLAGRLQELHALLPADTLDAAALQGWPHTPWSADDKSECADDLRSFFMWLDFLDQLTSEAPQVLAVKVAQCFHQAWLLNSLHPQLIHTCEQVVLGSTAVLCAVVRLLTSSSLLDQLVHFLLKTPPLMPLLLQRCNHISDQISMTSLCLVEELLQKPHRDILDVLVLSFLQSRSYLSAGQEDRAVEGSESGEDSQDLEDDPFFSDTLSDPQLLPPPLPDSCTAPPPPPPAGLGSTADIVNSFLCLVPVQVRSSQLLQEGGYESYVHDAHTLVTQCQTLSLSWDWPQALPCPSGEEAHFFEGPLLKVLFDRLGRILEQPYELNLQLTAVLSRLSAYSHPLLHEYLLDPYIPLSPCSRSLFSVLIRVMGEMMQRIQKIPDLPDRLLNTRRDLLGMSHNNGQEHLTLLKGIIVLEEFCKELAAIAFVKLPVEKDLPASPGCGSDRPQVETSTDTPDQVPGRTSPP